MNDRRPLGAMWVRGDSLCYIDERGVPRRVTGIVDPTGAQSKGGRFSPAASLITLLLILGIAAAMLAYWGIFGP